MTELAITHQRIDDIPLLLALIIEMGIPQQIDHQIQPHGLWQGISVGKVIAIWLCYILTEHDHRLVVVREWTNERREVFNRLLGIELRETDMTDDRLANVLSMLGAAKTQTALDQAFVQAWVTVYELSAEATRHDSTTVSIYQEADAGDGLMGYGPSKDHRPDLAQFKVMLSTLDPLGLPLTCQGMNGKRADDELYIPSYDGTVTALGHRRVLAVGDSKMGVLATRAYLAGHGSSYPCAFREPAAEPEEVRQWIETALGHPADWQTVEHLDEATGEITPVAQVYAWERDQSDTHPLTGDRFTWNERGLVARSEAMQAGLMTKREQARQRLYAALDQLAQPPHQGRKRYRQEEELAQEVTRLQDKYLLTGLVVVTLTTEPHRDGGQRWRVATYHCDEAAWQRMVEHHGWTVYLSNVPITLYSDSDLVLTYRRQLAQDDALIVGLNPASKTQGTPRPTAERLLNVSGNITFSIIHLGQTIHYHVTPLTLTQQRILSLLHLSDDVYLCLAEAQPKPLFNLRE